MFYNIAQYIIVVVLTFMLSYYIINYNIRIKAKGISMVFKSQSAVYNKIKPFIPVAEKQARISQSMSHINSHMLKVMVIEDKAYWVKDNIFFVAETDSGTVLHDSAQQVDTANMSKSELDKMMFILDKLKEQ